MGSWNQKGPQWGVPKVVRDRHENVVTMAGVGRMTRDAQTNSHHTIMT